MTETWNIDLRINCFKIIPVYYNIIHYIVQNNHVGNKTNIKQYYFKPTVNNIVLQSRLTNQNQAFQRAVKKIWEMSLFFVQTVQFIW